TLVLEWATGMCAATFFDPIPSVFHGLLVALVPSVNLWVWWTLRQGDLRHGRIQEWLNGMAMGVSGYYAILFLPMTPFGVLGIVFYGFGLLPCAALFACISTVFLRSRLRRLGEEGAWRMPGFWRGTAVGLLAVLALNGPVWMTRLGMEWAAGDDQVMRERGLRWLRFVGHEETLRRACYGRTRRAAEMDPVEWIIGGTPLSPEQARELYYRVTGRAFNTVPAPQVRTGRGAFAAMDEWTWDADQGGDRVGGRIKGLTLHSTRLDAILEPDAAIGYCEWTLEFKNDAVTDHEARAQILLPPGGVVSRLTLWVNGEEREAAFAGRAHVREAYQKVAIRQRRDPVLVSTCGPDRVLMQCFPVPRDGGIMKVRLGITVPLLMDEAAQGLWRWPSFVERNFTIREAVRHSVWMQSSQDLTSACDRLQPGPTPHTLQGQLSEDELASVRSLIRVARNREVSSAWVRDTRSAEPVIVRQNLVSKAGTVPSRLVIVVDRSVAMAEAFSELADSFTHLPAGLDWGLVIAEDEPVWLRKPGENNSASALVSDRVRRLRARGGCDNIPALLAGWDVAAAKPGALVLWIHGPQPVELSTIEPLRQRLERSGGNLQLLSVQGTQGLNLLLQRLDGLSAARAFPRLDRLGEDLRRLFVNWNLEGSRWERVYQAHPSTDSPGSGVESTLHLARLWANDEVIRLKKARRLEEAVRVAACYQIVTPVSGAVVLETAQQFAENNLTPADPTTIPSIPEPSVTVFLVIGLIFLTLRGQSRKPARKTVE
ncbi:MAG TPA: hypothetical protein PK256_17090, partial [Verrucomicrobiota bacterium]|nr:hypothetical protein [Verrucomicrobiota bacterium]